MKKLCLLLMLCLLAVSVLPGAIAEPAAEPLKVVATIFPVYDWVREVTKGLEDEVELTLLMDSGVDLHSFQPTAQDMLRIATCDLFVYVGGESDEWVEDALAESVNPDQKAIHLLKALGEDAREEELLEGMEPEEEEEEDEEEPEYDEHIWLSLRNAEKLVQVIADALSEADPAHADAYQANAAAYIAKLADLDARYTETIEAAAYDTLLFGDRFPFRYLAEDYSLRCYAAFSGCSAETEASFETIVFLAGKLEEYHLPAVLTIEGATHRIAQTVIAASKEGEKPILVLNSMQGITGEMARETTYLEIMEENLEVLQQALN